MRRAARVWTTAILTSPLVLAGCTSASSDDPLDPSRQDVPVTTDACAEVRAGIDAFNLGDFDETIDRFRDAEPLAEAQLAADDSQAATDLLEAVRYYANLPADEYPDAAQSSADFEKYKQITLGQCVPIGEPAAEPPVET
jgi:hypothetical protein